MPIKKVKKSISNKSDKALIKENQELKLRLEKMEKQLKGNKPLDDLKSKFISIVSHQLRTPLNGMRWNIELFLTGDIGELTEEQKKFLWLTYEINQKLLNTISDILLALDIEQQSLRLDHQNLSIFDLLKVILLDFERDISTKKHKVIVNEDVESVPILLLDQQKIAEVIKKLLDNAIKYTKEKGKINLSARYVGNKLFFTISDNGIGIPKGGNNEIFRKFFRGSNASTMYPDASGLGLFICKSYIDLMKGKIWTESEEGKGTKVHFEIPAEKS